MNLRSDEILEVHAVGVRRYETAWRAYVPGYNGRLIAMAHVYRAALAALCIRKRRISPDAV